MSGKSRERKVFIDCRGERCGRTEVSGAGSETSQSPGQRKPCQKQVLVSDSGNQDDFASARSSDFERLQLGGMNDDLNHISGC